MTLSTFHFLLTPLATQLPQLPEGPSLKNVRTPVEASGGYELWQIALATIIMLAVIAVVGWFLLRSRKEQPQMIDPYAEAKAEIEAASQAADDDRFAMLCSNAVRRFLVARYDLGVSAQTSSELIQRLPVESDINAKLENFLARCDGVKFAGQSLTKEERSALSDTAHELVEANKRKEADEQ